MQRKTKILIITQSAALPTGMAETTRLIFGNLLKLYPHQYELEQIGLFHCYAVTNPPWPIHKTRTIKNSKGQLLFAPKDQYGQQTFLKLSPPLQPDILFA